MSEMCKQEAIDIIKAERECVYRQGRTGECCRDDMGCGACDLVREDANIMEAYNMAIEALNERPHGEWIIRRNKQEAHIYSVCSKCNVPYLDTDFPNFCPNCGADMRKEGEAE